jgi:hypothetical protein
MKYFMDTHDRTKGSFPTEELTEEQFFARTKKPSGKPTRPSTSRSTPSRKSGA